MATDLIRYDLLVQDAIRGVVRTVLADAARDGLPGEHHFFITFRTQASGVRLSTAMRERYPNEMTIILQHQFWNLSVADKSFEVGLSFHGKPETVVVPFDAVTSFADPSVPFSFKFELEPDVVEANANETPAAAEVPAPAVEAPAPPAAALATSKPAPRPALPKPAPVPVVGDGAAEGGEAKIVSIDAFRKKP